MEKLQLAATKRDIIGDKVRVLRGQGFLPGVLYGKKFESVPVQVSYKDFLKVYEKAGESTIVDLKVSSETYPVVIHDVSLDPVKDNFIHVDFYKIKLDEKIKVDVPLKFLGESEAVRDLGGVLVTNIHEVEIEALPLNLPHEIEVDISSLNTFEDHIFIKDLTVPENVKILAEGEEIVVSVQSPRKDEEEEVKATEVEDVEVISKEVKEGEEAPEAGPSTEGETKKEEKKEEKK